MKNKNRNQFIELYIRKLLQKISEEYGINASEEQITSIIKHFQNLKGDLEAEIIPQIDKLSEQAIKSIKEQIEIGKLRFNRKRISFNDEFEITSVNSNGETISAPIKIKTNNEKAGKGHNAPLIVDMNGIKGYFKNSMDTSTFSYDNFEYIICQLGKKLGISMAETYKVYQNGFNMGIISEGVEKEGDQKYDLSDIMGSEEIQHMFGMTPEKIEELKREYKKIKKKQVKVTSKEGKDYTLSILEDEEDIDRAIRFFPQIIEAFPIPEEQKERIIKQYYEMVMLDLITGNIDRNVNNYGIIRRKDGSIELTPLFDNSTIAIPHIPSNLTIISSYHVDKEKLLKVLFERHYDRIQSLSARLFDEREEIRDFMLKISDKELFPSEKKWLLEESIFPNLDAINKQEELKRQEEKEKNGNIR